MDGGIADNLALRPLTNTVASDEDRMRLIDDLRLLKVRRIVLLVADGQSLRNEKRAQQRRISGIGNVFDAVTGTQIDAYNWETLLLAGRTLREFERTLRCARCRSRVPVDRHRCDDVHAFMVHVSLRGEGAEKLGEIPTGLTIPGKHVDAIIEFARAKIAGHVRLRQFMDDFSAGRMYQEPSPNCAADRSGEFD
jgi:hypothetical protein